MEREGYNLRSRFIAQPRPTSVIEIKAKEPEINDDIRKLFIDKLAILVKKTLDDYNLLESFEKRGELGNQMKWTLRRYLEELLRHNVIEQNEYNKNLPHHSVIAETNLFLLEYSMNDV